MMHGQKNINLFVYVIVHSRQNAGILS